MLSLLFRELILVISGIVVISLAVAITVAGDMQKQHNIRSGQAVIQAAKIRLRPRVMTSTTTMMGFLPLAFNVGEGGDMLQPMAVAAIGGLGMEYPGRPVLDALYVRDCE